MATKVLCDQFRNEQFVPAHQVRTLLSVYIASRAERIANKGLGCLVKDVLSGEEKKMKLAELLKMHVMFPNGKRVKAYQLQCGKTYTMLGTPVRQNYGVFIVPKGKKYGYEYQGMELAPGSCIIWDGEKSRVIGYWLFRKLFIMSPNLISAGRMRVAKAWNNSYASMASSTAKPTRHQTVVRGGSQTIPNYAEANKSVSSPHMVQQTHNPNQVHQNYQAQGKTNYTSTVKYVVVGRILHNGELVGLVLTDGKRQARIKLQQCLVYAERGEIQNVKAVMRNGTKFLSGNGMSLEALPYIQV